MQEILIDRRQLILEDDVEVLDDGRVALHYETPGGAFFEDFRRRRKAQSSASERGLGNPD